MSDSDKRNIKWSDKYSVSISRIDDEHKQFIDVINKAIATKEHNDNQKNKGQTLFYLISVCPYYVCPYYVNYFRIITEF